MRNDSVHIRYDGGHVLGRNRRCFAPCGKGRQFMTHAEYKRRKTREKTGTIARMCLFCGNIDEWPENKSDGRICTSCGRQTTAIGFVKPRRPQDDDLERVARRPFRVPESVEQKLVVEWARRAECTWPEIALLHHIPNGGQRDKAVAAKLKTEGVKAGVPDLCLPVPRGKYHGLYIEMKATGGRPSREQTALFAGRGRCHEYQHEKSAEAFGRIV